MNGFCQLASIHRIRKKLPAPSRTVAIPFPVKKAQEALEFRISILPSRPFGFVADMFCTPELSIFARVSSGGGLHCI